MMFKICESRCNQCLFSDQRIVGKKRMAEIIKDCRKTDSYFVCHKHDDVMCRGYYETQPAPQMLRIAERLRMVEFVPHNGSNRKANRRAVRPVRLSDGLYTEV